MFSSFLADVLMFVFSVWCFLQEISDVFPGRKSHRRQQPFSPQKSVNFVPVAGLRGCLKRTKRGKISSRISKKHFSHHLPVTGKSGYFL